MAIVGLVITHCARGLARTDGEIGAAQEVFRTTVGGSVGTGLAIDGQRFLVVTTAEDMTSSPITVVLNWTAELKR